MGNHQKNIGLSRRRNIGENKMIEKEVDQIICPVCGKYEFKEPFEDCPICNWTNDIVQADYPDWAGCGNIMSLNEARKAYAEGREII
jgi:ssDNA-binding Zn-finger/Zn-ribbon topoisomerase 1